MSVVAFWDTETNGLLKEASKMHSVGIEYSDGGVVSAADQYGYTPIKEALELLGEADVRVAHNGQDFDERVTRKLYPWWSPKECSTALDTLLISKLLYPTIYKDGPNSFKCPPALRMRHSLEAWGWRLGEKKDKGFDGGDWQTWSHEMQTYMMQDVVVLRRLFNFLMRQKPSPAAVKVEHDFAAIIRRQESWGFTFDKEEALKLEAELTLKTQELEAELIERYGEFWIGSKPVKVRGTRNVKLPDFPDITVPRYGTTGKELKPYVGPPFCTYYQGAEYTPVEFVQFKPGSSIHVELMLKQRHGWVPKVFTKKTGAVKIDDDVLRSLPYPEAPKLADLYQMDKILGYIAKGKNAWLKTAFEEGHEWRQHGRVNTIGTYTFRCSHSNPNLAQVPTRSPEYGHRCRALFTARKGFKLVGFDGSGMQLRLMAHHMAKWDGGRYAQVFVDGIDPHKFMRDSIGVDLMGEGDEGRKKGKTIDYALPFGGGEARLGSIIDPTATEARKKEIGRLVKSRLAPTFGDGFEKMQSAIRTQVQEKGYLIGLDGRKAPCNKAHIGLSTLLQMGEAIVMRNALVILDDALKARGLHCGVDQAGIAHPEFADYEFCANVHDEAQADVREEHLDTFRELALWCVAEAGRRLNLRCPLASDVKIGDTWVDTH